MNGPTDNIVVRGIGWVDGTRAKAPWQETDLFAYPVKNMGRFDTVTRLTLCACALALRDAGLSYREGQKLDLGLIGTSESGSLPANRAYFQDYLQAGRTLARGNLFIYTLPSSPLAEAAIHFGLQGPMLFYGFPGGGLGNLLEAGAGLLADGMATGLLAVRYDEQAAMAILLGTGEAGTRPRMTMAGVKACVKENASIGELSLRLERAMKGSGESS